MEDGQIAHIQYEHDGTLLQEQQVWKQHIFIDFIAILNLW